MAHTQQIEHFFLWILFEIGLQEEPQETAVLVDGLISLLATVVGKISLTEYLFLRKIERIHYFFHEKLNV
jgi:hypothetical protein